MDGVMTDSFTRPIQVTWLRTVLGQGDKSSNEKMAEWITDKTNFMEIEDVLHPIDDNNTGLEKELEDCIERLREEQRKCIRLFYYENKCYNDIAKDLSTNENKVKSYLQNGKRNLKICLEEKNERR